MGGGVFVALGDSFTEGVGDRSSRLPNGVRGWADRVAEKLAKAEPGWEYANLAIRSKRLRHIIDEQLEPALAMEPTLITLYAGGNDILDFGTDMDVLMAQYEALVARLAATGATLVLFTGFDVKVSAVLEPLKKRNAAVQPAGARTCRQIRGRPGGLLVLRSLPRPPDVGHGPAAHVQGRPQVPGGPGPGPPRRAAQDQPQGVGAPSRG